jgi:riboflavin-specific deaminase-like protein
LPQVDQVFPSSLAGVDGPALYRSDARHGPADRPFVVVNMVASVDGAISLDGVSGGLSGPGDKAIFFALRAVADVILVGAGTVRAEDYGPPRPSAADRAARVERGQAEHPTIAVVTGRLDLDPEARLFQDTSNRPIILTHEQADPRRRARLESVADVVPAGADHLDPVRALGLLHARGARVVVCEGGPTLNHALFASDGVDELCITFSPLLAAGDDPRVIRGPTLHPPRRLRLDRQLVEDGFVFSRYLVAR